MSKDVTGVIIIHNDASLLRQTLRTAIDYVDRLVVVDGAYEWVAPFCNINNEDPTKSTDDLIDILSETGLPYKYYSGIWKNETQKRIFSLEMVDTDHAMMIDSDELYEIDEVKLGFYYESGKPIADCYFPLYFKADVIGISSGLGTPPVKQIFVNKAAASARQIVDSMFLMVPEGERLEKLSNRDHYQDIVGCVHHLSSFRVDGSAYRRSRFYNLLAMRVTKSLATFGGGIFDSDSNFYERICRLDKTSLDALDNLFRFHRIAAAFPNIKDNQILKKIDVKRDDIAAVISSAYEAMLGEQYTNTNKNSGKKFDVLSGKPIFLDITKCFHDAAIGLSVISSDAEDIDLVAYYCDGLIRLHGALECTKDIAGEWVFVLERPADSSSRCVVEITPRSNSRITDFMFKIKS